LGWLFFSTDTGKRSWFNIILSIPLIWRMTRYYYLVRRCRYMKLMLISGMNYVETFKTLRDVLSIPLYQDMIERILAWLQKGDTIYDSLKHENFLIPSNVSVLIKVGEETANLENAVWNVLDMYQEELNVTINRLAKVIEPIMLVFIGLIVVVIASWVFWLILQIMEGAGM
jgi:type II secretory pathway component PulF